MSSAFSIALSGLKAQSQAINTTGNNLANMNTNGFKGSMVDFEDMLSQAMGVAQGSQVGMGVSAPISSQLFTQGPITTSSSFLATAIQGNGFFVVRDANNQQLFRRDGDFTNDLNGGLETRTGERVQGWVADANGIINTSGVPSDIVLPTGAALPPTPTKNITTNINLDASATSYTVGGQTTYAPGAQVLAFQTSVGSANVTIAAGDTLATAISKINAQTANLGVYAYANSVGTGISFTGPSSFSVNATAPGVFAAAGNNVATGNASGTFGSFSTAVEAVDSLGESHELMFTLTKTGSNSWIYDVTMPASDLGGTGNPVSLLSAPGTLTFNTDGTLNSGGGAIALSNPTALADGAANLSINWNIASSGTGAITQYAQASNLSSPTHDGAPAAQLTQFSIQNGGQIVASFSNGKQKVVGQLGLASIQNPDSLQNVGNNNFAATSSTAAPALGAPQTGGRGQILGGSLEGSNVDMASEFTNLITYQSAYQANSRVISTADQMTQDLMNLIH
jgi:flagellar hook protein FlgE